MTSEKNKEGAEQSAPNLDLFHHCAFWAWAEIYEETGQWPPDSEKTKQRAYKLYETSTKESNHETTS